MTVAHGPLYAFFSIHLESVGYSKSSIGGLWAIGVVAEIAVFALQPRWSRRFSMASILIASLAIAVLRFVLIAIGTDSPTLLIIAQIMHGATFGSYHVAALALVHRQFGEGIAVRGQALYTAVSYGAGGMVGALAGGLMWDSVGPQMTFAVAAACAAIGLLTALRGRTIWK